LDLTEKQKESDQNMKTRSILAALFLIIGAATVGLAVPPDQPYMQAAKADLQTARAELQMATRDKGGHRAKAVGLVNSAIAEVNAGIEFDRRHNHAVGSSSTVIPDQPHMQAALDALQRAKGNLERATADKGGHRVRALGYVNDAIAEVNLGIAAGR
jgi:hypothetical protein